MVATTYPSDLFCHPGQEQTPGGYNEETHAFTLSPNASIPHVRCIIEPTNVKYDNNIERKQSSKP